MQAFKLQWGRAPEGAESASTAATADQPRELQWGRAPEGAERLRGLWRELRKTCASMGPRPGGRGEAGRVDSGPNRGRSFNGAAPRRARRDLRDAITDRNLSASMGPRPGGRGELRILIQSFTTRPRFNGAAPRRARREHTQPKLQLHSNSFNGAAPRRARRDAPPQTTLRLSACFNGAAPRRARREVPGQDARYGQL